MLKHDVKRTGTLLLSLTAAAAVGYAGAAWQLRGTSARAVSWVCAGTTSRSR